MADGVGGHVRQHQVGFPAKRLVQRLGRGFLHEVHFEDDDPVDRVGRQQVDADDPRFRDLATNNLRPAAGRNAKVDDPRAALQEAEPLVEFGQLVRRAAAISVGLGATHIGVVELPLEPADRARLATLGSLDPLPVALAAPAHWPLLTGHIRHGP
jgi:hypothetical protein